nr:hypothetical protein CFP56_52522 [Quercus suber]
MSLMVAEEKLSITVCASEDSLRHVKNDLSGAGTTQCCCRRCCYSGETWGISRPVAVAGARRPPFLAGPSLPATYRVFMFSSATAVKDCSELCSLREKSNPSPGEQMTVLRAPINLGYRYSVSGGRLVEISEGQTINFLS